MSSNNRSGFTLIELIIVVVIMGILAAIFIPNYLAMENRAKEYKVKSAAHTLQLAVEDYAVRNKGEYPTQMEDIIHLLPRNPHTNAFDDSAELFVNGEPQLPGQIGYTPPQTGNPYQIKAYGNNGVIVHITGY